MLHQPTTAILGVSCKWNFWPDVDGLDDAASLVQSRHDGSLKERSDLLAELGQAKDLSYKARNML